MQKPIELVGVDGDEDQIPADAGPQIAAGMPEVEDFERQSDDGHQPQPEYVGQPVGNRDQQVGEMTKPIVEAEDRRYLVHRPPSRWRAFRLSARRLK